MQILQKLIYDDVVTSTRHSPIHSTGGNRKQADKVLLLIFFCIKTKFIQPFKLPQTLEQIINKIFVTNTINKAVLTCPHSVPIYPVNDRTDHRLKSKLM